MQDELVQLVDVYQQPGFLMLMRDVSGERAGCVGVRDLGVSESSGLRTGEVRRLFVREEFRRGGEGRMLASEMISTAQETGFSRLVLNTLPSMIEAIALYETLGFTLCDPYVDDPLAGTLYFSLELIHSNR